MRLTIDTDARTLTRENGSGSETLDLYSREAFEVISDQWLKVGWNEKYPYTFSWLGRPIIQIPEDIIRVQEALHRVQPDVIVETGVAHGGSLILYASLCKAMDRGRVIGVDVEIRPHNREAIEAHPLSPLITLVEGDSAAASTAARVAQLLQPGERVMVVLDSCHSKSHVAAELDHFHPFVGAGSYLVVADGSMKDLADVPRGQRCWEWDNPSAAVLEFIERHPEFKLEEPAWPFAESKLRRRITHWPNAWLRRS